MGLTAWTNKTVDRRPSRVLRSAAPAVCGGRRGTHLLAAADSAPAARQGAGHSAHGPAPISSRRVDARAASSVTRRVPLSLAGASTRTASPDQGPSYGDALAALGRVHRRVTHELAQSTRARIVAPRRRPPSRARTSRPPAA